MNINIILYNTETNKTHFKLSSGIRPWGILLAISKGRFCLSFPASEQQHIIAPYEIAYVPPNTDFCREIIEPIDFHQFAFQICNLNHPFGMLPAGKLNIPKEHVRAILDSADMIPFFPAETDWLAEHILHRILVDATLFPSAAPTLHVNQEIFLITNYIMEHLNEPLSVSTLAAKLHLSHNGLIWKFKKELNVTPINYITMCRINRAKQLLFDTDLTISQIAENCGYSNSYYFSNVFKKCEGTSPSDFRRKCNK